MATNPTAERLSDAAIRVRAGFEGETGDFAIAVLAGVLTLLAHEIGDRTLSDACAVASDLLLGSLTPKRAGTPDGR